MKSHMLSWGSAAAIAWGIGIAPGAGAATISASTGIQHTEHNPCIISAANCPHQPDTFAFTAYNNGQANSPLEQSSPDYSVQAIIDALGGATSFFVGFDVSDTNVAQTLDYFRMLVNGIVVDAFDPDDDFAVPSTNPGSGFADYLIGEFSLVGLSLDSTVRFDVRMPLINDGPEQWFLVAGNVAPIPVPAALPLFLTAFGGLGFLGWRRRRSAATV